MIAAVWEEIWAILENCRRFSEKVQPRMPSIKDRHLDNNLPGSLLYDFVKELLHIIYLLGSKDLHYLDDPTKSFGRKMNQFSLKEFN